MKTVKKSVLIQFSTQQMFELVADVARYPEFLPWCDTARVIERDEHGMTAEVGIAMKGLRQSFTTRNTHMHDAASGVRHIDMQLLKGPFSRLGGRWTFTPLAAPAGLAGTGAGAGSRVELALEYGFDSLALSLLVGPAFDRIANTMVEAFVERARTVYEGTSI